MEDHTHLGNSTLPLFYLSFNKEKVHLAMRANFGRLKKSSKQATSHPHADNYRD
jgi:hypothetical protein